jgi:hypothetical protein
LLIRISIPKLEDHALSAVPDWLINLFAYTLHSEGSSSIRNLRTHHAIEYLNTSLSYTGVRRGVYRVLVGKPEGKKPLGRPRYRRENDIKMNLQEVGYEGMDWNHLVEDKRQVAGTC